MVPPTCLISVCSQAFLEFERLLFTQLPPQCGFQQVWEEMSSDPSSCSVWLCRALPGSCGCMGSASPVEQLSVSVSAACPCHILTGGWNSPGQECHQIHCSYTRIVPWSFTPVAQSVSDPQPCLCVQLGAANSIGLNEVSSCAQRWCHSAQPYTPCPYP